MEAVQTQAPLAFGLLPTPPRTLGDLRMSQNNYASAGSASANSMRPLLIVAVLIAVGAGIVWGLNKSPKNDAAPIVPAAASLPVIANEIPVAAPLIPLIKLEQASPVPSAAASDSRSIESVKPVKAKSVAAVKAAPVAAKKAAPVIETVAPAPEVAPPAAPPAAPPVAPPTPVTPVAPPVAPPTPVTPAAPPAAPPAPVTPAAIVIDEKPVAPPAVPPAQ